MTKKRWKILFDFFTLRNESEYFFATCLIKHTFQIDEENRFFYHLLLIIKPLDEELESVSTFEKVLRRELEIRENTNVYVITRHDIPDILGTKNIENKMILPITSFRELENIVEKNIVLRYQLNGRMITEEQIIEIINNTKKKLKVKQLIAN